MVYHYDNEKYLFKITMVYHHNNEKYLLHYYGLSL